MRSTSKAGQVESTLDLKSFNLLLVRPRPYYPKWQLALRSPLTNAPAQCWIAHRTGQRSDHRRVWGEKCTDNGSLPCSAPTCSDLHNQSPFKAVRCGQAGRDIGRAGKRGGPMIVLVLGQGGPCCDCLYSMSLAFSGIRKVITKRFRTEWFYNTNKHSHKHLLLNVKFQNMFLYQFCTNFEKPPEECFLNWRAISFEPQARAK